MMNYVDSKYVHRKFSGKCLFLYKASFLQSIFENYITTMHTMKIFTFKHWYVCYKNLYDYIFSKKIKSI